jgi:hypothetical protein
MQKRTYFQFENPAENLHFMVTSKINCQLFACKAAARIKIQISVLIFFHLQNVFCFCPIQVVLRFYCTMNRTFLRWRLILVHDCITYMCLHNCMHCMRNFSYIKVQGGIKLSGVYLNLKEEPHDIWMGSEIILFYRKKYSSHNVPAKA